MLGDWKSKLSAITGAVKISKHGAHKAIASLANFWAKVEKKNCFAMIYNRESIAMPLKIKICQNSEHQRVNQQFCQLTKSFLGSKELLECAGNAGIFYKKRLFWMRWCRCSFETTYVNTYKTGITSRTRKTCE